jgi:hypothetical protein
MPITRKSLIIYTYIFLSIFISIFVTRSGALADNQPLWCQYAIVGQQALKAKNYVVSQRYYLGALKELEKLATKKQRLHLPRQQELELDAVNANMSMAFCKEPLALYEKPGPQNVGRQKSQAFDMGKALSDPSYTDQLLKQSRNDYDKRKAEIAQNVKLIDQNDIDRKRRMLAVYEVLLGPNSDSTRFCRESYKDSQERASRDSAYNPTSPHGATSNLRAADKSEWQNLKQQAIQAELSKNYAEVARLYQLAITEAKKFPPNDTRLAQTLQQLGGEESLYLGQYDKAEAHLKQSLALYEKILGKNDTAVLRVLMDLEDLYRRAGRKEDLQRTIGRTEAMGH